MMLNQNYEHSMKVGNELRSSKLLKCRLTTNHYREAREGPRNCPSTFFSVRTIEQLPLICAEVNCPPRHTAYDTAIFSLPWYAWYCPTKKILPRDDNTACPLRSHSTSLGLSLRIRSIVWQEIGASSTTPTAQRCALPIPLHRRQHTPTIQQNAVRKIRPDNKTKCKADEVVFWGSTFLSESNA